MSKTKLITIVLGILILGTTSVLFTVRVNDTNTKLISDDLPLHTERKDIQTPISTNDYTVNEYSYGASERHNLDVYQGEATLPAPIIVMVHGGAWSIGDKANSNVVDNKIAHYLPKGYIFISVNYPLLPEAAPDVQADSIAQAIVYVQKNAAAWGGDANNLIVMGHSAGAHLAALVSSTRTQYAELAPWSGTVILDSAALDVVSLMENDPKRFHDRAFGSNIQYWQETSPLYQLNKTTEPIFIVCSTYRAGVCDEANNFADTADLLGTTVSVLPVALKHEPINTDLGIPGTYTDAVDAFLTSITQ
jgi:acetyl esterase/lipase